MNGSLYRDYVRRLPQFVYVGMLVEAFFVASISPARSPACVSVSSSRDCAGVCRRVCKRGWKANLKANSYQLATGSLTWPVNSSGLKVSLIHLQLVASSTRGSRKALWIYSMSSAHLFVGDLGCLNKNTWWLILFWSFISEELNRKRWLKISLATARQMFNKNFFKKKYNLQSLSENLNINYSCDFCSLNEKIPTCFPSVCIPKRSRRIC